MTTGSAALTAITIAVSRGPRVLVSCIALNIRLYALYFKMVLEMFSFGSQTHVTRNKHGVYCTSKFYKLSEPTGSEISVSCQIIVLSIIKNCVQQNYFTINKIDNVSVT